MKKRIFFLIGRCIVLNLLLLHFIGCNGIKEREGQFSPPPFELRNESLVYVDSIVSTLSLEDKVAQLFTFNLTNVLSSDSLLIDSILRHKVGGLHLEEVSIIPFLGFAKSLAPKMDIPPFIVSTEPFLLNNQFKESIDVPNSQTLFSLPNDTLKLNLAELHLSQIKQLGFNLAIGTPISTVPKELLDNRIKEDSIFSIPNRALIHSQLESGILTIAQPLDILELIESLERIKNVNNRDKNYNRLDKNLSGLYIKENWLKDTTKKEEIFDRLSFLRKNLSFNGLLITKLEKEEQLLDVLKAPIDHLITNLPPKETLDKTIAYINSGEISVTVINDKIRRILKAKAWMKNGLHLKDLYENLTKEKVLEKNIALQINQVKGRNLTIPLKVSPDLTFNFISHLSNPNWEILARDLYERSIIIVNNKDNELPFSNIYNRQFKLIQYGKTPLNTFEQYFENYVSNVSKRFYKVNRGDTLPLPNIQEESTNILLLGDATLDSKKDAVFINEVLDRARRSKIVLLNFGAISNLIPFNKNLSIVQIFELNRMTEQLGAQLFFGAVPVQGILPFSINQYFKPETNHTFQPIRQKFTIAEEVGIASEKLVSIDAIAKSAIDSRAMPGCQILVAKEGKIIYSKSFGYHTYSSNKPVKASDLYDIASITKVAATTLAIMKLYEESYFNLSDRIKEHLELGNPSTIGNIRIRDLLIHDSGLQPNMPINPYVFVKDSSVAKQRYFNDAPIYPYTIPVADHFYFNQNSLDSLLLSVYKLDLNRRKGYRYSDVNFILLQQLIETWTGKPLNEYLEETFYKPMGLQRTLFRPTSKYDTSVIVPTQLDNKWRMQLIQGYVHDETAALLGGVAGNNGLFSTAEEMAVIFQMLLNGGTYGGKRYLEKRTIDFFTSSRHGNHRGLGFDKKYPNKQSTIALSASLNSYGHTGFTGTCVWVDPDSELIYIFLSNRIHPSRSNYGLITLRVRERIHQVVYDALNSYNGETSGLNPSLYLSFR